MKISSFTREKLVSLMGSHPAVKEFCDALELASESSPSGLDRRVTDLEAKAVVEAESSETLLQGVAGCEDLITGLAQRVRALEDTARTVEDIDPLADPATEEDPPETETAEEDPPVDPHGA